MNYTTAHVTPRSPSLRHVNNFQHQRNSLAWISGDLLLEISSFFDCRLDVLNFGLVSKHILWNVFPALYSDVVLSSATQCLNTLKMLQGQPEIARHVLRLVINLDTKNTLMASQDRETATTAVVELAMTRRLDALIKFEWDSDEMPPQDDMWFTLRMCCPQLRYIGTSIGCSLPMSNSNLFDFVDLLGFSITLKPPFYQNHLDVFLNEDIVAYRSFWEMIINRCPNLQELTIEGYSTGPADIHPLVNARWPRLRKLSLGDLAVDWFDRVMLNNTTVKNTFITFLEAHPTLESLGLSRLNLQTSHLTTLDKSSLTHVTEFSGTLEQLQALQHLYPSLKSVKFRDPMPTRELTPSAVSAVLQQLPALVSLKITFVLHSMYDTGTLLFSLAVGCPHIRELELMCARRPSFQLSTLSKALRTFEKLRSLHLTVVRHPGDETMSSGATRIALANPRLENFTITFLPASPPLQLPFSIPLLPIPFPAKAVGKYTVTCDHHGLPLSLAALERQHTIWPCGLGVSHSSRRYVRDLRPIGCPGRAKPGLRGILALLLERSNAGEEMRVILFCISLCVMSMCWVIGYRSLGVTGI